MQANIRQYDSRQNKSRHRNAIRDNAIWITTTTNKTISNKTKQYKTNFITIWNKTSYNKIIHYMIKQQVNIRQSMNMNYATRHGKTLKDKARWANTRQQQST